MSWMDDAQEIKPDAHWMEGASELPHEAPGALDAVKNFGKDALDYSLRALDYGAGATRTAAAGTAGAVNYLAGGEQPVTRDDVIRTLQGKAPTTNEYMNKFGVPEGNVHVPLVGDVSSRAVGGFIGDVLLDPLTYATFGASAAAKPAEVAAQQGVKQLAGDVAKSPSLREKLARYLTPASRSIESAGDSVYKSAYKVPDAKLDKLGVNPIGPIMLENGRPSGSSKTLQTAIDDLMSKKMEDRAALYQAVNEAGGMVDMRTAMQPAGERAKELMRIDPNAGAQVEGMGDWLKNYLREGEQIPVDLASDWKTRLYKASLPANAFNPMTGTALPIAGDIQKSFASGLKNQIEAASNAVIPGAGDKISALNSEIGPLLESSRKIIPTEVRKDATKNAFSSIDGINLGLALEHPSYIPSFVLKKALDIYNTPYGRTKVGNALSAVGRSNAVDLAGRRAIIDANNPWVTLEKR